MLKIKTTKKELTLLQDHKKKALNNLINGEFWKFDVWFVGEIDKEKDDYMEFIKAKLTDESRYEILKLKTERNKKKEDTPSFSIYSNVLKK